MSDEQLARLMQRPASWPRNARAFAKRRGVAPDLPVAIPCDSQRAIRYRKADVVRWMATGSRRRTS